jgi:pyruvate dehydrogenase complex dehydrogenase (E1) component
MEEVVDGDYQNYKAKGGAYTREHFFGAYPELKEMVANPNAVLKRGVATGGAGARRPS